MSTVSHRAGAKAIICLAALSLLFVAPVLGQTAYTLTVKTDSASYTPSQSIKVSGAVSPAPGSSYSPSGVTIRIMNPSGTVVAIGNAAVDSGAGTYQYTFVAGGTSSWVAGKYTVNATWGASPPTIFVTTTFTYSTTTTTSSSVTTTIPTTSTSHTTTSTTTSSTTPPTPTATTSTSSQPSTSTTTPSSSGGIPEFPVQPLIVVAFTVMIVALYLYARQGAKKQTR